MLVLAFSRSIFQDGINCTEAHIPQIGFLEIIDHVERGEQEEAGGKRDGEDPRHCEEGGEHGGWCVLFRS